MFAPVPYEPRPVRFAGVTTHGGWRLKRYEISLPGRAIDPAAYEDGLPLVLRALAGPAETPARPGVGFLILHTGLDAGGSDVHYVVLAWWDRVNELFTRVLVRADGGGAWAEGVGAPCVWDLRVVAHERDAFVRHLLTREPDAGAYLQDAFAGPE